jgi:hypothetical protein
MKPIVIIKIVVFVLIFMLAGTNSVISQTSDSTKTVKIKIIKEVDGVQTIIDTTYEVSADEEEPQVIFSSGKTQANNNDETENYYDDYKTYNTSKPDDVKYITDELGDLFTSISASIPVFSSYVDDNGMKVFTLSNVGSKEIELMKKCNNSIYIDDQEIVIPTIKFAEGENSTDILIIKQRCGSEVEVEKIEIPRVPAPVIDIVETDNGKKQVVISNENKEVIEIIEFDENEKIEEEEIQTIFGSKKQQQSIDELEIEMDNINDNSQTNKTDEETEDISENDEEQVSFVVVESTDAQLKKLQDKNIETELNSNIENLKIQNFVISNDTKNNQITVSFSSDEKYNSIIKIYDIDGNLIHTETVENSNDTFKKQFDGSSINEGIYFIQIIQNNKFETKHFIVTE